ncbi:MAG: histidinol-phosphatase [Sphaerochaetaceae bacterium]
MSKIFRFSNFHTHCSLDDGTGALEDYVRQAISQDLSALGFSCHTPMPFFDEWHMKKADFPYYLEEINRLRELYKDEIELYIGLELDYLEDTGELAGSEYSDYLDFTIASLHMMKHAKSGQYLTIDGPVKEFVTLLEDNFSGDIRRFATHYFSLQEKMVNTYKFDILGHCDLIKKRNSYNLFFDEHASWYRDLTTNFLRNICDKAVRLEISTGGIARNSIKETYPSPEMVKECARLGIPLTLNSDAHYSLHITHFFEEAKELLIDAGHKTVDTLKEGKWISVPLL